VVRLDDVADHPAHDPAMGFFHIEARFVVDAESTGSSGTVLGQARSAADGGAHALHRHPHAGEFFCLMDGEGVQIAADGEEVPIRPGDVTYVPAGEWHGFRNTGDVETRAIFGFFGVDSRVAAGYEVKG
jgi:mannose-6-phosphate isomerase-like protein (cupin superfamily)